MRKITANTKCEQIKRVVIIKSIPLISEAAALMESPSHQMEYEGNGGSMKCVQHS